MFQRMFWPSDHAGETDSLGQQGFWVCWAVAVVTLVLLMVNGHYWLAMLQFAFFALGGVGVREHSVLAAALVAVAFWTNQIYGMTQGRFPGFIWLAGGVLLIANIRGTYVASKWAKRGDPDAFPERMQSTLKERFVDQMPLAVWPKGQFVFYAVAAVYMGLLVVGTARFSTNKAVHATNAEPAEKKELTIQLAPAR